MKSGHHLLPPERAIFAPPNRQNNSCSYMEIPGGAYAFGYPSTPPLGHEQSAPPFRGIEFQPSKLCPRNFIIFDQNDFKSRVMFHPAIVPKFGPAGVQNQQPAAYVDSGFGAVNEEDKEEVSSCRNEEEEEEDSDEIDALMMSLDEEEYDEEDEMSTARTNYGCRSPDSCSNYGPPKLKRRRKCSGVEGSSNSCSSRSGTKKEKMKKMVKALRGIVPGGQRMNSATLLDEAVNYLKSLKVEAQKLGDM